MQCISWLMISGLTNKYTYSYSSHTVVCLAGMPWKSDTSFVKPDWACSEMCLLNNHWQGILKLSSCDENLSLTHFISKTDKTNCAETLTSAHWLQIPLLETGCFALSSKCNSGKSGSVINNRLYISVQPVDQCSQWLGEGLIRISSMTSQNQNKGQ